MAGLDDILTTQKNGVVGINSIVSALNYIARGQGQYTTVTVTSPTLISTSKGFIVNFCVTVAGSAVGTIYNTNSITSPAASAALCVIPNTVGIVQTGQVFSTGLVIVPGSGQSVNVTYSLG